MNTTKSGKTRESDTIPRLHQLVPHMSDFLIRMSRTSGTFEDAREGYAETVVRLAASGLGRRTASRVSDNDAYWAPTTELLGEGIRLGFIERQPLPSSRRHLNAHRDTRFKLTELGSEVADLAQSAPAAFTSRLADATLAAHPYMREFLDLIDEEALICPEIREGQIESSGREERDTSYWAGWASDLINANTETPVTTQEAVKAEMTQAVTKRFGPKPDPRPSNKALAETFNDAFSAASLRARGVAIGANNLKVLKAWGSQLLLFDESRYVYAYPDCNVVWLASDLQKSDGLIISARRRGLNQYGEALARAIVGAYRRQAQERRSELIKHPYLPIHEVRAEAAYECRVTRALADMVLERLAAGEFVDLAVDVWLHLSGGEVPRSEPIYRRGGTRRISMTIANKEPITSKEKQ